MVIILLTLRTFSLDYVLKLLRENGLSIIVGTKRVDSLSGYQLRELTLTHSSGT